MESLNLGLWSKVKSFILVGGIVLASTLSSSQQVSAMEMELDVPGMQGPYIMLEDNTLNISLVIEQLSLDGGFRKDIPQYRDSYIEFTPDAGSEGMMVSMQFSIDNFFNTELYGEKRQKLPGGRALPGVPFGRLPGVRLSIDALNGTTFYLNKKFFGVFIPLSFDIGTNNIVTFRYHSKGRRAGNISLVGADEYGENSGLLILLDIKKQTREALQARQAYYQN